MRLSNYKNIPANKASISITATLYDRRALDCTTDKPLVNSLNNLTFLASSSAKVRETLVSDGGLLRLVDILNDCFLEPNDEELLGSHLNGLAFDLDASEYSDELRVSREQFSKAYINFQNVFFEYFNELLKEVSSLGLPNQQFNASAKFSYDNLFHSSSTNERVQKHGSSKSPLRLLKLNENLSKHFEVFMTYLKNYRDKRDFIQRKIANEKKILVSWKWTLTLQVLVLCGTRGNEKIRKKIVKSGIIQIVATVLDNYLLVKSGKVKVNNNQGAAESPSRTRSNPGSTHLNLNNQPIPAEALAVSDGQVLAVSSETEEISPEQLYERFNEIFSSIYDVVCNMNGQPSSRNVNISIADIEHQVHHFVQNSINASNDIQTRIVPPDQLHSLVNLLLETVSLLSKTSHLCNQRESATESGNEQNSSTENESASQLLSSLDVNLRLITTLMRNLSNNLREINHNFDVLHSFPAANNNGNINNSSGTTNGNAGPSVDEINDLINTTNALNSEAGFNQASYRDPEGTSAAVTSPSILLPVSDQRPANELRILTGGSTAASMNAEQSLENITSMAQEISEGVANFGQIQASSGEIHGEENDANSRLSSEEVAGNRGNFSDSSLWEIADTNNIRRKFNQALREIIFDDNSNSQHASVIVLDDVHVVGPNNQHKYWSAATGNNEICLSLDESGSLHVVCNTVLSRRHTVLKDLFIICKEFGKTEHNAQGVIGLERYTGKFSIFVGDESAAVGENFTVQDSPFYYNVLAHLFKNVFFRDLEGNFRINLESSELLGSRGREFSANATDNNSAAEVNVPTDRGNFNISNGNDNNNSNDNSVVTGNNAVQTDEIVNNVGGRNAIDAVGDNTVTNDDGNNDDNSDDGNNDGNNDDEDVNQYFDFVLFSPPREFYKGKIIPSDDDIIWVLQLLAFVSKYSYMKDVLQYSYILPKLSLREYPNDAIGMKYRGSRPVDDYSNTAFKGTKIDLDAVSRQIVENHFKRGWGKAGNELFMLNEKRNTNIRDLAFLFPNDATSFFGYSSPLFSTPDVYLSLSRNMMDIMNNISDQTEPRQNNIAATSGQAHRAIRKDDESIEDQLFSLKINCELEKFNENFGLLERTNREDIAELFYLISRYKDMVSNSIIGSNFEKLGNVLAHKCSRSLDDCDNDNNDNSNDNMSSDDSSGDEIESVELGNSYNSEYIDCRLMQPPDVEVQGLSRREVERFHVKYLAIDSFNNSSIDNVLSSINDMGGEVATAEDSNSASITREKMGDKIKSDEELNDVNSGAINTKIDKSIFMYEINKKFEKILKINFKLISKLKKIKHYEKKKSYVQKKWNYDDYDFDDYDYLPTVNFSEKASETQEEKDSYQKLKQNFIHLPLNYCRSPIIASLVDNYHKDLPSIDSANFYPSSQKEQESFKFGRSTIISKHDLDYSAIPLDYLNVFGLVEQFSVDTYSSDISHWAGVIMRNSCRKHEQKGGIRQCANTKCGKWETDRKFSKCRRCRRAKYCDKKCQHEAWPFHKYWCQPASSSSSTTSGSTSANNGSRHHHHHHHHHRSSGRHRNSQQNGVGGSESGGAAAVADDASVVAGSALETEPVTTGSGPRNSDARGEGANNQEDTQMAGIADF